jgi:transposase
LRAIVVLVFNTRMSREPIYTTGHWTRQHVSDFWRLWEDQLQDNDGLGRDLDCVCDPTAASLILVATVRRAVKEFKLSLDELHKDSTSVTVYGPYAGAWQEGRLRGRRTHAITWGHNKDHRPDLKRLLYILTVTEDGGVPVDVSFAGRNVVDSQTHQQTWPPLRELVGNSRVLYVADCKLARTENMNYSTQEGR